MLKYLALAALLAGPATSLAQEHVTLIECKVTMALPGEEPMDMRFHAKTVDNTIKGFVDQYVAGAVFTQPSTLTMGFDQVREGLSPLSISEDLNLAEKLIAHAMGVEAMPELASFMNSGIELEKVRSARTFTFGDSTNMGSTTVVEALDQDGQLLGSFLGGFLVAPCK